jgi:hypothetical protein
MITIGDGFAAVLVTALRDSLLRRSEIIDSSEVGDVAELEEFLVHLGLLEGEVRKQYLVLQKQNPQMIPYAELWPESEHEPHGPPDLKLIE